ncbi:MAG TPA: sulfatase [Ktedonobacteraceae bacterium]|nr:sulfatase [Ktedonobacteraceae bacterium]
MQKENYPNILYLHSHDTGRYVQPYGYAVPTPNIQHFAEEGVLFRKAFCTAPTCSGSRSVLLTGQYAHSNGMMGLAHRGFALRNYQQHILYTLRKAGYYSLLIGEQHISKTPDILGYDRVFDIKTTHVDMVAPAAISVLRNPPEQPFFLSVGFFETHREFFQPASPEDANYCLPPANLPDTPQTRRDMAAFKASARALDQGVGAVLNALDACGLRNNTLVILTTDHGLAFPGAKGNLFDRGIGVMLMMRGPGGFVGGQVCDALVSHIDIFPTICDLLKIEPPRWLQGRSFLPLIRHQRAEVRDTIFAELTYHAAYDPQRAARTQRWKYIHRFSDHLGPVLPNCDDGPSKSLLLTYGWKDRPIAAEQLYDLIFDPNEMCNLANDPAYASVLEEMRQRLEAWMIETDDPLLQGPVPAPAGAMLNDPDQVSAGDPTYIVESSKPAATD